MNHFSREPGTRAPNREEVEEIMRRARRMRAEVTRNAMLRLWSMLRRNMSRKDAGGAPRHA